ncbi:unnamed protein product, partial [Effrenium voratum]
SPLKLCYLAMQRCVKVNRGDGILRRAGENARADGQAQLLSVLRRSRPREDWIEAAAGFCLGGQFKDASQYAEAISEACCYRKLWQVAKEVLDEMRVRGIARELPCYIAAIRSCGKSAWRQALAFFEQMRSDRMEQGALSHKATLKALEHAQRWQEVLALLGSMQARGPAPGLEEYSLAFRVCETRNTAAAKYLLGSLDALILRDELNMCGEDWSRALDIFKDISSKRLVPDREIYSSTMQILEQSSQWVKALQLLGEWRTRGYAADEVTYSLMVKSCLREEKLEEAIVLTKELLQAGLQLPTEIYEALIVACSARDQWQWAVFFWQAAQGGITDPDVHESIIRACQVAGEWQWILTILKAMEEVSLQPSITAYSSAISACEEAQKWEWARELQQKVDRVKDSVAPEAKVATAAVKDVDALQEGELTKESLRGVLESSAQSWQFSLAMLRQMQSRQVQPSLDAFNSAVAACQQGGQVDAAISVAEEMEQAGFDLDIKLYNELINWLEPGKAQKTPAAIRQSWSMPPGSFRLVRRKHGGRRPKKGRSQRPP